MAPVKDRAAALLERARARSRLLDHAIRTQQHYGKVKANLSAGAVTYFAFLSFFPILALAFFVVGYLAKVYPGAQDNLASAIQTALPGLIGDRADQLSLTDIQGAAGTVGLLGLLGVLYSGLGWVSGMRDALIGVFQQSPALEPGFVIGKVRDVLTLAVIGATLGLSVAISGLVTGFSTEFLDLIGLSRGLAPLLALLGVVVGGAADMLLFFTLFKLLARPHLPARSLWAGALLGAIGAEILKWASSFLIGATENQPAFKAFGIALILLVWINYFSRVVMYAAAWAAVARPRAAASAETSRAGAAEEGGLRRIGDPTEDRETAGRRTPRRTPPDVPASAWFGVGAAAMLGLMAVFRTRWLRRVR